MFKTIFLLALLASVAYAEPSIQFTHPLADDVLDAREYIVVTYEYDDMPYSSRSADYEFFMQILGFGEQILRNEPIGVTAFRRGRYDFSTTLGETTAYGYQIRIVMANYTGGVSFTNFVSERFTIINSRDNNDDPSMGVPGNNPDLSPSDYTPSYPDKFDPDQSSASSRLRPFWF